MAYSMSEDEKDQIVGRLVREARAVEQSLQMRRAWARRQGEIFAHVAGVLSRNPENLQFENISSESDYQTRDGRLVKPQDLDAAKLIDLVLAIRADCEKKKTMDRELASLGV